jgi:hypothetical protein
MLYRVVLIFPDLEKMADFAGNLEVPGETTNLETALVENMTENIVMTAVKDYDAYVREMQEIE